MGKEKSEKSTKPSVNFPAGEWPVFIRDESVYIGRLNLVEVSQLPPQYEGAIDFDENPRFGPIADGAFSVEIATFDPETGVIYFKIPAAAEVYNPKTNPPYQFVFEGFCEPGKLHGTAKVPKDFGKVPGLLGEDGDIVNWTSKGPTDSSPKS